jgi:MarR family transcriptional regulator, lower aerobic nicotinate degradation pathway regulator
MVTADDADDAVTDGLVQTAFAVTAVLTRVAAAHDLSLSQLRLLGVLRDRTPTMAELADLLGLDRSTVTGLIDRAAARGLVRRAPNDQDQRSFRVASTADGQALAARGAAEVADLLTPMTARLPAAERRRLAQLLARMLPAPDTRT